MGHPLPVQTTSPRPDDLTLLRGYHNGGDRRARDRLIERHLALVKAIAARYRDRGEPFDDLVQVGSIGLIKAIDRFDRRRGEGLIAFASATIEGEIKRHLRDRGAAIKMPRRVRETRVALARAEDELRDRLGRPATPFELARHAGVSEPEAERALEAAGAAAPLPLAAAEWARTDRQSSEPDGSLETAESRVLLGEGFRCLGERERSILYLHYFRGFSQARIARELGLSQSHVSRLTQNALDALHERLDAAPAKPAAGKPEGPTLPRMAPQQIMALEQYLELPYSIAVKRAGGASDSASWTADVAELPGCTAGGDTPEEAVGALKDAMATWISDALAHGREVPEPRPPASHSGRLLLRMAHSLHRELAEAAEREQVSLNQYITGVLSSAVGWRQDDQPGDPEPADGDPPPAPHDPPASGRSRLVRVALAANFAVVVVAAALAVVLLILAWQH